MRTDHLEGAAMSEPITVIGYRLPDNYPELREMRWRRKKRIVRIMMFLLRFAFVGFLLLALFGVFR